MKRIVLFFVALAFFSGSPAAAQSPRSLGAFKDWEAFSITENGDLFCYMASAPEKEEGDYAKRGQVWSMVHHRPAGKERDVVSFRAGYTFKPGSNVTVIIGKASFELFTDSQGRAWGRRAKDDRALVRAMRRGSSMVVKGISSRGTVTTDTYSLSGVTAAYKAISAACGVK